MTTSLNDVINISIKDYLNGIGIETRREGNKYFASSPFSRDSNWSFCVYPTNTYFDWANGHGGNIINLVARLQRISTKEAFKLLSKGISHEKYKPNYKIFKAPIPQQESLEPFDYQKYINTDPEECKKIKEYAASRGITEGYVCGVFYERGQKWRIVADDQHAVETKWVRVPALAFIHVDKNLKPCGIKFRRIDNKEPRFSARGNLGFYIMDNFVPAKNSNFFSTSQPHPVSYVVESETSANSLSMWLKQQNSPSIVISRGGVSSAPAIEDLPEKYQKLKKKLIIDYDGNEKLYQQRLKLYEGLHATPIKIILPKGEDINSLYNQNKMWMIENLLLN